MTVISPIRSISPSSGHSLAGTFVEPQPNYFAELQKTYRNFPGMVYVPCAIATEPGTMTMYSLDCSSGRLPGWAHGVGTLSREQIQKFGDQIDDIDSWIRSQDVECITVAELLRRASHPDPDIVWSTPKVLITPSFRSSILPICRPNS